jgi:hypothetical protein
MDPWPSPRVGRTPSCLVFASEGMLHAILSNAGGIGRLCTVRVQVVQTVTSFGTRPVSKDTLTGRLDQF